MDDFISRQAVIDTVRKIILGFFSDEDGVMNDTEKTLLSVSKAVCNGVREFPSAQPKKRTEERTETHACDLISRQAAIDALMEFDKKLRKINWHRYPYTEHECRGVDEAIVKIMNLPSAQPERRWIPCSERMPKKNGFYLCTTKDCITILEFIEGNPHYHEEPSFVSDVLGKCNSYVVAWMPLPEPYAERRTDE